MPPLALTSSLLAQLDRLHYHPGSPAGRDCKCVYPCAINASTARDAILSTVCVVRRLVLWLRRLGFASLTSHVCNSCRLPWALTRLGSPPDWQPYHLHLVPAKTIPRHGEVNVDRSAPADPRENMLPASSSSAAPFSCRGKSLVEQYFPDMGKQTAMLRVPVPMSGCYSKPCRWHRALHDSRHETR